MDSYNGFDHRLVPLYVPEVEKLLADRSHCLDVNLRKASCEQPRHRMKKTKDGLHVSVSVIIKVNTNGIRYGAYFS